MMRVALYQNNPIFGETEKNVISVLAAVENEAFDLLVIPELFATGYQFKNRQELKSLADQVGDGYTFNRLKDLARYKQALIVYGFPERDNDYLYNSALAIAPDGHYHLYRKTHLFDTEKNVFDPGDTGFKVFQYRKYRIGMMICFDWRFPESARRLALDGAQIICHPSNLVLPHCPDAMITRALENNVFTITCDRVGSESHSGTKLTFIGKSRIIGPDGRILGELGDTETAFLAAGIDPQLADNKSITPHNEIFADRRPEYY
nr:hypothetical protein [candidate division Zixibacteria bacterium]